MRVFLEGRSLAVFEQGQESMTPEKLTEARKKAVMRNRCILWQGTLDLMYCSWVVINVVANSDCVSESSGGQIVVSLKESVSW